MKNKLLTMLVMLSSHYVIAEPQHSDANVIAQLAVMKEQCESCSIAMQDYISIKQEACNSIIDSTGFEKAFTSSPMITAMMTVHSIDKNAYRSQFVPIARKYINCLDDSLWLDATRKQYSTHYSN